MPTAESFSLRVTRKSLVDFLNACDRVGPDADRELTTTFRTVGEIVRNGAAFRTLPAHARSAGGYREAVSGDGVVISQAIGKTTGDHPEWGSWMMRRALLPALNSNGRRIAGEFWNAVDEVCDRFETD